MLRDGKWMGRHQAKVPRLMLLAMTLVFVSGFDNCFEERTITGYRVQAGQLHLPRVETLEMRGLEGPGADDIEHAFVRELLRSTSYAVLDTKLGYGQLLTPPAYDEELGSVARSASIVGKVVHNELVDDYSVHNEYGMPMYTRRGSVHMSVALRFIDRHTGELLDSSVLEFSGDLPSETVTSPGMGLHASENAIAALFPLRDVQSISQEGYAHLATTLSQQLQGNAKVTSVRLFISNRIQAYDPLFAASDMAQRGDWAGAAALYRRAFSRLQHSGMPSPAIAARLQANLAACYCMLGRLEEAVALYDRALRYEFVPSIQEEKARCEQWLAEASFAQPVVHGNW